MDRISLLVGFRRERGRMLPGMQVWVKVFMIIGI